MSDQMPRDSTTAPIKVTRTGLMTEEHKAKIRAALKRYNADGGHLKKYHVGGKDHPNWKGGIKAAVYQRIAFEAYPYQCNRCSHVPEDEDEQLFVHHKDRNRRNSEVSNLEILCRTCHMQEHHRIRVDWTCPQCGQTVQLIPFLAQGRRFCSIECRLENRTKGGTFGSSQTL